VVRPPVDSSAIPLDRKRLEEINVFFGESSEIVADSPFEERRQGAETLDLDFLSMVRRRPLRAIDIANALGLSIDDVEDLIKGLLIKGLICSQKHSGEIYYISNEKDVL